MKTWTLEERYRELKDKNEILDLYESIKDSPYRQNYHIQPITGLLSDPNGFVYDGDQWHLFYQWCPWGAVHGLKYWYHVSSPDLIHWKNEGIGLKPDTFFDNKGVHSGSGITKDNKTYLFYTGNHRDENWIRTPYTCLATLEDGKIQKLSEPLFGPDNNYSEHQRDPKIIYNSEKNKYYILIGAQDKDLKGTILIYSSDTLDSNWNFEGRLKVDGVDELGGMWECPSLVKVGDQDVLIFSPQYTKLPFRNNSTNHNVYFIGKMDYDNLTFYPDGPYNFLDYGFDFYAAQPANNEFDKNHPILIGWIGLPDNHYPTEEEDWEGSLSLPRHLKIENNRLIQTPLKEFKNLRKEWGITDILPKSAELNIKVLDESDFFLHLFKKENGKGGFTIDYDSKNRQLILDKSLLEKRFNQDIGEKLTIPLEEPIRKFEIFIDSNSIEIFFNNGEKVFTAHIFPTESEKYYKASDNLDIMIWEIENTNTNNFKL